MTHGMRDSSNKHRRRVLQDCPELVIETVIAHIHDLRDVVSFANCHESFSETTARLLPSLYRKWYGRHALRKAAHEGLAHVVASLSKDPDSDQLCSARRCRAAVVEAAGAGHTEVVMLLLDAFERRENKDDKKATRRGSRCFVPALSEACAKGRVDTVDALSRHRMFSTGRKRDVYGSALWSASSRGHVEVVRLMLKRMEEDSVYADPDGLKTCLYSASQGGFREMTELLMSEMDRSQISIQRYDVYAMKLVFSTACKFGWLSIAERCFPYCYSDSNSVASVGDAAHMCNNGWYDMSVRMVDSGSMDRPYTWSEVIKLASLQGISPVVGALIGRYQNGLIPHDKNFIERTLKSALDNACTGGHRQVAEMLMLVLMTETGV